MSHTAANGQEITDAMIENWCDSYEHGEFPEGEHTVGDAVMGRPPASADKTVAQNVKTPLVTKTNSAKKAEELETLFGVSASQIEEWDKMACEGILPGEART